MRLFRSAMIFAALSNLSMIAYAQSYFPNIVISDFPDPVVGGDDADVDDRSASEIYRDAVAARPVVNDQAAMRFTLSVARRNANRMQYIAQMKQQNPAVGDGLEQSFQGSDPLQSLDQVMRAGGFSSSNLADVFAIWWLSSWQVSNGDFEMEATDAQIAGVKNQAAAMMVNWPGLGEMTNEQKQDVADNFMMTTLMVISAAQGAKINPQSAPAIQQFVRAPAAQLGMDLTAYRITDQGFVLR